MHTPRNPADLLGLGRDPSLIRLLRACGTDEACITGPASDYDKFTALAAALPLCEGHPLRDEVNAKLAQATGYNAPLCPHTANAHWDAWVKVHWYSLGVSSSLPMDCFLCSPVAPTVWNEKNLIRMPDPRTVLASDLPIWSNILEGYISDGVPMLISLPHDYTFVRPNPYHANLAVGKVFRGEVLDKSERDLLITQALRIWGIALARHEVEWSSSLLLRGGDPIEITSVLDYLNTSKALPPMIWIPDDPASVGNISGLYARVRTGYSLKDGDTAETAEEKRRIYATVAPIGRAMVLAEG